MAVYDITGEEITEGYDLSGTLLEDAYDIDGERVGFEPRRQWLETAIVTKLYDIPVGGTRQGGCTDGEYIYQTSGDTSGYTYMDIVKIKISDGTYTTKRFSGTPNFGHANDMTYNPNTGYLYVCTMLSDGSVIVLDASDLSYVDTIYLTNASGNPYTVWQFCYDRLTEKYYSASGGNYLVYDENWDYVSSIAMPPHPNATAQGCETDGEYFYRVCFNPDGFDVVTMDGQYVTYIEADIPDEPEDLMYDWNGHYYLCTNTGYLNFGVYQITLFTWSGT